jgi:hypothetical protein
MQTPNARRTGQAGRHPKRSRYILELEPAARHPNPIRSLRAVLKNVGALAASACVKQRSREDRILLLQPRWQRAGVGELRNLLVADDERIIQ